MVKAKKPNKVIWGYSRKELDLPYLKEPEVTAMHGNQNNLDAILPLPRSTGSVQDKCTFFSINKLNSDYPQVFHPFVRCLHTLKSFLQLLPQSKFYASNPSYTLFSQ